MAFDQLTVRSGENGMAVHLLIKVEFMVVGKNRGEDPREQWVLSMFRGLGSFCLLFCTES